MSICIIKDVPLIVNLVYNHIYEEEYGICSKEEVLKEVTQFIKSFQSIIPVLVGISADQLADDIIDLDALIAGGS